MIRNKMIPMIALLLLVGAISVWGADRPVTVALIPDGLSQPERMPLQNYLAEHLGREVRVFVPNSYKEAVDGLADGNVDFACLGALMYVRAKAKFGVVPLVQRSSDLQFHSVFITNSSSIHSLRDLKGKKFAFGDINSASAHLMPYVELKRAGMNPESDFQFRYSGAHDITVKLVESGIVDAGVTDETVFNSMIGSGKIDRSKVRVFYTSKPYVDYAYVARKGIPDSVREKFVEAFLDLKEGKDDQVLKILRANHYVKVNDEEYASLRQVARELNMF
ncbi:MAG TPA: phosphate/phosphite/phosphonate ABC transporter substrate-binding protein [Candidatus Angelobacter sp.]|nr:phosphate/phosphite/phosphonate ABC transporter substrate-binding protein [Candidatus Angelobacter sp.]